MRAVADLAERYGHDEIRVSHEQNLVLPHVHRSYLPAVFEALSQHDLASPNAGLISDIIACPGMDYCSLATARSIPIAQDIATHFSDSAYAESIGEMKIKISGCINACAHHHVTENMTLGERAGPGIAAEQVVPAIERVVKVYLKSRDNPDEPFLDTCRRIGASPFKEALYDTGE